MPKPGAFFNQVDDYHFKPTDHCRGPWDINACHAGPPTGLLARAVEHAIPDKRLTRLAVDLLRPIPFEGFTVTAEITKNGRRTASASATLTDLHGKTCVMARSLHIACLQTQHPLPTYTAPPLPLELANPGPFPIQTLHDKPAFNGTGVQVRYPSDSDSQPGPSTVWMKTVPLLDTEAPSPFQLICPLADCGNAFSRNAEPADVSFINPDLSIVLNRDPVGEWFASVSHGYWEPTGIGMADALLYDTKGVVGRAVQTMLLQAN